ncbi:MAG: ATP-dependent Clp protease adaptor ClpS [Desulfobulbaceae bacterium]|nr:ATP-dependent Clp protease adaptor ClpS [Desulfobulbaceae bacterium]
MSAPVKHTEGETLTEYQQQVREPSLYKVLLHNDDYTSMEFVTMILETVFNKSIQEASTIMMNVHRQGIGVAGIYSKDIAETKKQIVTDQARSNNFPLRCSTERA